MVDGIVLVNLEDSESYVFQFFPNKVSTDDQTNWQPQDVMAGVKPLQYANREPQRIEMPDVLLDGSDTGESVEPDIKTLRSLMAEKAGDVPPTLLYICGRDQRRVVLVGLRIDRELFSQQGEPLRARASLTLLEQHRVERVTVTATEPDE